MVDTTPPSLPGALSMLMHATLPDIPLEPVRPDYDWTSSKLGLCDLCGSRKHCVKVDGENHCASCTDTAYLGAWKDYGRALRETLAVAPLIVPEGWRLVPESPTPEMLRRGWENCLGEYDPRGAYADLLANLPPAPRPLLEAVAVHDAEAAAAAERLQLSKLLLAQTICSTLACNRTLRNLDDPDAEVDGGDAVEQIGELWPAIKQAAAPH